MARMRFQIAASASGVSLQTYTTATAKFLQLLREIDSAISGKGGGMVNWYVVDAKSNERESNQRAESFIIEIESKLKPAPQRTRQPIRDTAQAVAISFVKGFENIEYKGISPPYLSEFGLERLQAMMALLHRNGARGFTAEVLEPNRAVAVTDKAAKTLAELLPPRRSEEGSVEGTLETVSVHKNKKFVIYDSLTGKGVTCLIDDDSTLALASTNLGKKVRVAGKVFFNIKEEPVRVAVQSLRVLGLKKPLTVAQLTGSDPEFTGNLTTDEYIRSIRRG
jgi:hypothetical protein